MFYHEFLYLLCNTQDRIEAIVNNHKVQLKSKKGVIYQWEISEGSTELQRRLAKLHTKIMGTTDAKPAGALTKPKTSHIDLLGDNAFKNEAPQHLVEEALARFADEHRLKFEGAQKEKSKRVTADSLDQMFEKRFEYLIRQKEKLGKEGVYVDPDD